MNKLFEDFIYTPEEEWYKQATKEIGSAKSLLSNSYEGIVTKAIYTRNDLTGIGLSAINLKRENNTWLCLEEVEVFDENMANRTAIDALQNGADGVYFTLKTKEVDLEVLLNQIWIDNCVISFRCEKENTLWLKDFLTYYNRNYKKPADLRGWITLSAGLSAEDKGFNESFYSALPELTSSFPNFYAFSSDSATFINRGSDIIKEIAYTLSNAVDNIESSKSAGILPERVIHSTLFSITVGINFFFEISKLRALRLLWAKIAAGYGIELSPSDVQIHSKTSNWNKSSLDKENNIVRDAAEAMAAMIGGCNYLSFNTFLPKEAEDRTAKRTSRNISNVLKEESFLDKVADVSKGSYYIENLTKEIAEKSWALFLEIEKEGGYANALSKNIIQESIKIKKQEKLRDLNFRNKLSIGTNIYPNLKEHAKVTDQSQERATYEIEKLRGWVEQKYPARVTVLMGSWEGHFNRSQSDLLKNIFSSAGFIVEYQRDLKAFLDKDIYSKYLLILCLIDGSTLVENDLKFLEEFKVQPPIIFVGDSKLETSINQIPIEKLATPGSLKGILEKFI